jgi:hypothetical protein
MSDELHALAVLPPEKELPVSIRYEVGWAPKPIWMTWRGENF